jgi:hypothetical protein
MPSDSVQRQFHRRSADRIHGFHFEYLNEMLHALINNSDLQIRRASRWIVEMCVIRQGGGGYINSTGSQPHHASESALSSAVQWPDT